MKNISKKITILTAIVLLAITAIAIVANKNAILEANSKIQQKNQKLIGESGTAFVHFIGPDDSVKCLNNTVECRSIGVENPDVGDKMADVGGTVTMSGLTAKNGETAYGWTTDKNYSEGYEAYEAGSNNSSYKVSLDKLNLYPVTKVEYTVKFHLATDNIKSADCSVLYNKKCSIQNSNVLNGFTAPSGKKFLGWAESATATTPTYEGNESSKLLIAKRSGFTDGVYNLYPVYANTFTITFDFNDGTPLGTGISTTATVESGSTYTLPDGDNVISPPDENKVFDKWEVTPEGGDTVNKNSGETITVNANTIVKAIWKSKSYTIKFSAGGGSGTMASASATSGSKYKLPACTFTAPSGKSFSKWKIGTTEYSVGDEVTVDKDLTVTAVWKEATVLVTFNENISDGETIYDTRTVTIGSKLKETDLPENPTREGYKFVGWYTDKKGTNKFDFTKDISKDTFLYAKWAKSVEDFKFISVPTEPVDVKKGKISFEINIDLDVFIVSSYKVFVDNKLLEEDEDYELTSGSTIITLTDDYAAKLSSGSHTLKVEYDGESKTAEFAVAGNGSHDIDFGDEEGEGGDSHDDYGTVENPHTGVKYILILPLIIALVFILKELKKRSNSI